MVPVLAILFIGCGENYQGTYTGTGKVVANGCNAVANNPYNMEVQASVSSGSMELVVTKFTEAANNQSDSAYSLIAGPKIDATINGNTSFSDVNQSYLNTSTNTTDTVSASGNINADRSVISAFNFTRTTTLQGSTTACTFSVIADTLTKAQ
ncbi:MAG: hypothetical protein JWQ35_2618 [Bacteriovoracaceae bacterium]|nr:hypothetical protein [Bacteriovoracaceae bacterium]